MSIKALELAHKLLKPQLPSWSKVLSPGFKPAKDASNFGITTPAIVQQVTRELFLTLNDKEKALLDERDALLKQVSPNIPWKYYEEYCPDKQLLGMCKEMYDSLFDEKAINDFIEDVGPYKPTEEELSRDKPNPVVAKLEKRIDEINHEIEYNINPLLNPFADFWVYGLDGPEFKDVFEAKPHWNEMINKASDDFAFHFYAEDPFYSTETLESFVPPIKAKLLEYKPSSSDMQLLSDIGEGKIRDELFDHYNTQYLIPHEEEQFKIFTGDDRNGYALRDPWVPLESNPDGKYWGH